MADMRGNNRFRDLLETYAEQVSILYEAKHIKGRAYREILEMIGDAEEVIADDFIVTYYPVDFKEHVVPAKTIHMLRVRRKRR